MRIVVQRVSSASVDVGGERVAAIGRGLLCLVGLLEIDTSTDLDWAADKIVNLRIFPDQDGRMNLSVLDVGGEVLLVPNFTVGGSCRKGRRPSFDGAMEPARAAQEFDELVAQVRTRTDRVATGIFKADMAVALVNDGPVTLVLESPT